MLSDSRTLPLELISHFQVTAEKTSGEFWIHTSPYRHPLYPIELIPSASSCPRSTLQGFCSSPHQNLKGWKDTAKMQNVPNQTMYKSNSNLLFMIFKDFLQDCSSSSFPLSSFISFTVKPLAASNVACSFFGCTSSKPDTALSFWNWAQRGLFQVMSGFLFSRGSESCNAWDQTIFGQQLLLRLKLLGFSQMPQMDSTDVLSFESATWFSHVLLIRV